MVRSDTSWIPTQTDLDWIEAASAPSQPVFDEIERAAVNPRVPILDRSCARVARGKPKQDRRGRDGIRLLDAVDGAGTARRRNHRHDRSGLEPDRSGSRLVA